MHVASHCDDERRFGDSGDSKLIVFFLSLGPSAIFRWKAQSCPESASNSCCLHHSDLLIMHGSEGPGRVCSRDGFLSGSGAAKRYVLISSVSLLAPWWGHVAYRCVRRVHPFLQGLGNIDQFGVCGFSWWFCSYGGC